MTVVGPECWVGEEYLNDKCSVEVKCEAGNHCRLSIVRISTLSRILPRRSSYSIR